MTIDDLQLHMESLGIKVKREGVTLSTGGSLDLRSLTTLPEGVTLSADQVLSSRLTQQWNGRSLRAIDGVVMVPGTAHQQGRATVYSARYFGRPTNSDLVFVAQVGEHCAHGATARQAIDDAEAKAGLSNPQEAVDLIRATGVVTRTQYRILTGACREGVRQWCRSHGVEDDAESLPVAEVLRMTRGHYGHERLADLLRCVK